jgi:hypothetical protein
MGKLASSLLFIFCLEITLYLFVTATGGTTLLGMVLNLVNSGTTFNVWFLAIIGTIGTGAIIIGTFTSQVDWIFRASMVTLTFVTFSLVFGDLARFIYSFEATLGTTTPIVAAILIGPLMIYYLMVLIDFISGKD